VTPALLERLLAARSTGNPMALATLMPGGTQALIDGEGATGDLVLAPEDLAKVRSAIADDSSRTIETSLGPVFVEVWNPPLRLIVVGAVHIGQKLAPMAALAGYAVTVIDPRAAFASAERFPGVEIVADWPDDVLPGLKPDKRTAIVTLTHDPKIDDPALAAALRSDAFYIGALGSRKTHAKRSERLAAAGFGASEIARIRGPVGLAIGALTPAEIALSILAEVTAVLHRAGLALRPGAAA
jgi:xanthine dehydrogenase accessory factor